MTELLKNIIEKYAKEKGIRFDKAYNEIKNDTKLLSLAIALYAHDGQFRSNRDRYIVHPVGLRNTYCDLFNLDDSEFKEKPDVIESFGIPYYGVEEVCLLHDVVEDTNITLEDISLIFFETGNSKYFHDYIEIPLNLVTHIKSEPYEVYIKKVSQNPIASIVKIIDMFNNSLLLTCGSSEKYDLEKHLKYIVYCDYLNKKYKFSDKIKAFKIFGKIGNK